MLSKLFRPPLYRRPVPIQREVVGATEHFDHVVAGTTEELLERGFERMGAGASEPGANHLECHGRVI